MEYARALDVAGGDGRVVKELLCKLFREVDFFDHCLVAVGKARYLKLMTPQLKKVEQATMEGYQFNEQYNLILMSWCCGYLDDNELVAFLLKA